MMKKILIFAISFAVNTVYASSGEVIKPNIINGYTQINRYSEVKDTPTQAQLEPLNNEVMIVFPKSIKTVGQAMRYALKGTSYQLEPSSLSSHATQKLSNYSLPEVDRHMGPMSVEQVLLTLAGSSHQLVVDPVHRLIDFKLRHSYQGL